jgi:predicted nucleotidyltransferase
MRVPASQSHLRFPLNRLLGGVGNIRVLRSLVAYGAPLSVAQVARDSGLTPQGTRGVIASLLDQQIVVALGQSRAQLFAINSQHPLFDVVSALFGAERQRWKRIIEAVRDTLSGRPEIEAGWYYGSVARGEDEPASDLDLALLIADRAVEDTVESVRMALRQAEDALLFSASVVGVTSQDVARLAQGDPWWQSMIRDARPIVGPSPAQLAVRLDSTAAAP